MKYYLPMLLLIGGCASTLANKPYQYQSVFVETEVSSATGFYLKDFPTQIITAGHFCKTPILLPYKSLDMDICLIPNAPKPETVVDLRLGRVDKAELPAPISVYYVGYPEALPYSKVRGDCSNITLRGKLFYLCSFITAPGASGSPVIEVSTGNVIGMVIQYHEKIHFGIVLPSKYIKEFLDGKR